MQVNYVREHERFIEYAADERLSANEQLLWYALMHIFNQRAEGNEWPDGFIRVTNDRLFTYLPIKWDAMARARNALKQHGRIDFRNGNRNKAAPEYRILPFYPSYYPLKTDNTGGNEGGNTGGNERGNIQGNTGDFNININRTYTNPDRDIYTHSDQYRHPDARARLEDTYIDADGEERPCRFDGAFLTSDRARAAVAQRILDQFFGDMDSENAHRTMCEFMHDGMPPEIFEDEIRRYSSLSEYLSAMGGIFRRRRYEENRDQLEMNRCMRVAKGNKTMARFLYQHSDRYHGEADEA